MSAARPSTMPLPLPAKRRAAMLLRTLRALRRPGAEPTRPGLTAANLPTLHGAASIVRDRNGVSHVYAELDRDAYACLGFLQGSDRFLLIDALRTIGTGRLCEWLGDISLPAAAEVIGGRRLSEVDGFLRPLDFEGQSERDLEALAPDARAALDAYADGVNAALAALDGDYPTEYLAIGRVRPWRAVDCLIAQRTSGFVVSLLPMENELTFDAVRAQLGDALAQKVFPEAPWENAPASVPPEGTIPPEQPVHMPSAGSNNWAIAAERTAAGAPILANDPHVPLLPLPTYWTHVHVRTPRFEVQGGMFPGCPILGFGHNREIAWGCTTVMRDAFDFVRIHRLADDRTRYRTPDGTAAITAHRDERRTRRGRTVMLEWETCDHGILYPGWTHHDGTDLALRHVPSDGARYLEGYLALPAAESVDAHRACLESMNEGFFDFNHVYAHRDGHIAWEPIGRLPRRAKDGLFVRDAHDPDAQWQGTLPFKDAPKLVNPDCGFVCSANGIVDPAQFPPLATAVHFEPRLRHERIAAALAARSDHRTEHSLALQTDVGSDYGAPLRDALLPLLAAFDGEASREGEALALLADWDGRFTTDSAAAAVFFFTLQGMIRACFGPLLGPEVGRRYGAGRKARPRLHALLLDPADPLRPEIERAAGEPLAALARGAFRRALARVARACGEDPADWRWGRIQRARLGGPLSLVPRIGARFRILDEPFPGDDYTVNPSRAIDDGATLTAFVGASSRFVCDLARPDEAWFAHTSGPSGELGSQYHALSSRGWLRFEHFKSALWDADAVPEPLERIDVSAPPAAPVRRPAR